MDYMQDMLLIFCYSTRDVYVFYIWYMYHDEFLHFFLLHVHTELQSSLLLLQIHFFVAHFPLQEHEFSFSVGDAD